MLLQQDCFGSCLWSIRKQRDINLHLFLKVDEIEMGWFQHSHSPLSRLVEFLSHFYLKHVGLDDIFVAGPRHVNPIDEGVEHAGGVAPIPQPSYREEPWIIPTLYDSILNQFGDLSFGEEVAFDVESAILPYHWLVQREHVEYLVVELPANLKLQRAE